MHLIAYNLIRVLMAEAALVGNAPLDRMSFKGTLDAAHHSSLAIAKVPATHRNRRLALYAEMLATIASDIEEQRVVQNHRAARETNAFVELVDFIIGLWLHEPVGRALQDLSRIMHVQQPRAQSVKLILAHRLIAIKPFDARAQVRPIGNPVKLEAVPARCQAKIALVFKTGFSGVIRHNDAQPATS